MFKFFSSKKEKKSSPPLPVSREEWLFDEDFGPVRLRVFSDGSADLVWLEENSPYGIQFENEMKARAWAKEDGLSTKRSSAPSWSFSEDGIIWVED